MASLNTLESCYFSEITVIPFVLSTIVRQPELKKKPRSTRTITDHARLVETKALSIERICNYNNFTMFIDDTKKRFYLLRGGGRETHRKIKLLCYSSSQFVSEIEIQTYNGQMLPPAF